jgi:hypothetical protein
MNIRQYGSGAGTDVGQSHRCVLHTRVPMQFSNTRNFGAAARRTPCLNLLALVVSGNYLLLYLLKICGVVHFIWYGPIERSVVCLQDFLE